MRATEPRGAAAQAHTAARLLLVAAGLAFPGITAGQESPARADDGALRFAVLGHIRGDAEGPNFLLPELLSDVRRLGPDMVFLTGDMIWGDVHRDPVDPAIVTAEWEQLDSALATLDVPVYRTPGNHEISDVVARDIYEGRYGLPPRVFDRDGVRFILLTSAWIPEDGDTSKRRFVRGVQLDSAQVAFLREALDLSGDYEHAFVFMHHLLWWEDDARWWREVHPLLAPGRVRAVFGGDFGPMKFSHMERDGVQYFQSSIEGDVGVPILRALEASRLLSQQFDNYLFVTVDGERVDVDVETIGEVSSGHYTPQRWRAITEEEGGAVAALSRFWEDVRSPRRLVLLGACLFGALVIGVLLGRGPLRSRAGRDRG